MKKQFIVIALLTIFLNGCTTTQETGNSTLKNETQDTISKKIKENKTTQQQIREMFGDPESVYFDAGKEVWAYSLITTNYDTTHIPFVSMFYQNMDGNVKMKQLMILFNNNKTVYKYSFSNSNNQSSFKSGVTQ